MTRGLEAKSGDDCNAVVQFFVLLFFFLYSEITQRPVNVLKSVSICIKFALHLIKVEHSSWSMNQIHMKI